MSTPELHEPRPVFAAEEFGFLAGGHGAAKLSDSAVAPLVAAARGYATVTKDTLREAVTKLRLGAMNSSGARQLTRAVADTDAMVMPWTRMDNVLEAARNPDDHRVTPTSIQMRPSTPVFNDKGDPAKYINLAGSPTVLDVHPATPRGWFDDAPTILLTEGIIKGDAVLTALLREHGVTDDVLAQDHDGDVARARVALRGAMASIPAEHRVMIISFIGVANWRQNPEWTAFSLKGREAWVAYDADTAINRLVWKQASDLFVYLEESKKTKPPQLVRVPPVAGDPKAGLDDFFGAGAESGGGTWADVAGMLTDLPEPPSIDNGGAEVGEWRISPDGNAAQESRPILDAGGREVGTAWRDVVPLGGRVKSVEIRRAPSDDEIREGRIGAGVGAQGTPGQATVAGVEIEVKWLDKAGREQLAVIAGPAAILGYQPREWHRHGAEVPTSLLRHAHWPPKEGEKWLQAVKDNRTDDTREKIRWETMGWVPSEDGPPVFVVGEQVISGSGPLDGADIIGVGDHQLPGSSEFGVMFPESDYDEDPDEDAWMDQAREDLRAVVDIYIDSNAWTDPKVAATVLATALRPALPVPCKTACYFVGRRRSGKSWSAGAVMSFWQRTLNTWSNDRLPGAAKDTVASTEFAVSRTPIWVADDLAPSMSRQQAAAEEAALGDLIRSIHNRSGKRRMGPDMRAREVNKPKALLVVTAENEPSVSSVTDRAVMVNFGDGSLNPDQNVTQRVVQTWSEQPVTARLTSAFIRWFAWKAERLPGGWAQVYDMTSLAKGEARAFAAELISGSAEAGKSERHAQMASDLMVTYWMLAAFARDLGMEREFVRRFRAPGLPTQVALQVADAHDAQSTTSPGHALLEAVSTLLRSGRAHIANAERPADAPTNNLLLNRQLGWTPGKDEGEMRPNGASIGMLVKTNAKGGSNEEVVLLDAREAFNEAQRHFPELIPYGSKPSTSWASMWEERLTFSQAEGGWRRRSNGRHLTFSVQVRVDGNRITGVPVAIDLLVMGVPDEDDVADAPGLEVVAA